MSMNMTSHPPLLRRHPVGRHPGERRDPLHAFLDDGSTLQLWIPAFAGMTGSESVGMMESPR